MTLPPSPVPQPGSSSSPKLLDRLTAALHERNYTPALIHAYRDWVRRYIYFHKKRHPAELGSEDVAAFLDYLAGPGEASLFERAEAGKALRFLHDVLLEKPLV